MNLIIRKYTPTLFSCASGLQMNYVLVTNKLDDLIEDQKVSKFVHDFCILF